MNVDHNSITLTVAKNVNILSDIMESRVDKLHVHFLSAAHYTADKLTQFVEYQTAVQEVRGLNKLRRKCFLCNDVCEWLDFLVFLDTCKDDKPGAPSHNSSQLILWDVKEPLGM